jgi:hypothetical protein
MNYVQIPSTISGRLRIKNWRRSVEGDFESFASAIERNYEWLNPSVGPRDYRSGVAAAPD